MMLPISFGDQPHISPCPHASYSFSISSYFFLYSELSPVSLLPYNTPFPGNFPALVSCSPLCAPVLHYSSLLCSSELLSNPHLSQSFGYPPWVRLRSVRVASRTLPGLTGTCFSVSSLAHSIIIVLSFLASPPKLCPLQGSCAHWWLCLECFRFLSSLPP